MRFTAIFAVLALPMTILAAPVADPTAAEDALLFDAVQRSLEVRGIDIDAFDASLKAAGIDVRAIADHPLVRRFAADPQGHAHLLQSRDMPGDLIDFLGCGITDTLKNGLSYQTALTCFKNTVGKSFSSMISSGGTGGSPMGQ